ncbi:choice-of-anchor A family protein [Methylobacillus sp. Pita2]|uniref:choice-of-anchor A family protein n=1 Tax=Methylobacillus sp. Pita2 TaxID=3383245 RepID=UPI0038B51B01
MKTKLGMLAVLAAISAPAAAGTIDLGVASDYNAFIFGDYRTSGNSVAGALAVGGDATLSSNSIANGKHNEYGLVVGGDFNQVSGGSLNGNAWIGGNNGITQQYSVSGHVDTAATVGAPIDFASAQDYLASLSSGLAGVDATGTYSKPNNWTQALTGSGSAVEFFSLDASDFISANFALNNIVSGATLIFNVAGSDVTLGWPWQVLNGNYNVLFNFYEATSVRLENASINASILAVNATITGSGNLYGTVVANQWDNAMTLGNGSFTVTETALFSGITTAVPEPHDYALLLAGLGVIGLTAARRRKILARK